MGQEKRKLPYRVIRAETDVHSKAHGRPEEECQSSHLDGFPKVFLEDMTAGLGFEGEGGVGLGNEE